MGGSSDFIQCTPNISRSFFFILFTEGIHSLPEFGPKYYYRSCCVVCIVVLYCKAIHRESIVRVLKLITKHLIISVITHVVQFCNSKTVGAWQNRYIHSCWNIDWIDIDISPLLSSEIYIMRMMYRVDLTLNVNTIYQLHQNLEIIDFW